MRVRLFCFLVILVAGAVTVPASGTEKLQMAVSPKVSYAPAIVRVRFNIDRHADNRKLEVAVESGGYFRSSTIQIDGDDGPATVAIEYEGLPPGEYVIAGFLMDASEHNRAIASRRTTVF